MPSRSSVQLSRRRPKEKHSGSWHRLNTLGIVTHEEHLALQCIQLYKGQNVHRKWQQPTSELKHIKGVFIQKHTAAIFSTLMHVYPLTQLQAMQHGAHQLACGADSINLWCVTAQKSVCINAHSLHLGVEDQRALRSPIKYSFKGLFHSLSNASGP